MAALARFLQDIFDTLGLPPWAGTAVVLGALVLALPFIPRNRNTDLARKELRASERLATAERAAAEQAVLARVGEHPMGLLVVAEEAHKLGRDDLARAAIARLRRTDKLVAELRAVERAVEGPMPATVDEAALTLHRLLDAGMVDVARQKADRFLGRWPDEVELRALRAKAYEGSGETPES
jgi:plasmid replication initiation protein